MLSNMYGQIEHLNGREKTCRISDKDTETEAEQEGPELEEKTHNEIFSRRAKTI